MPFNFYAFSLLGDDGNCIREAHLIPVISREAPDFLDHGWKIIESAHVPQLLGEHHLEINDRLTRLFGYPVAARRS